MADYLSSVLKEYGLSDKKDSGQEYLESVLGEYGLSEQKAPASRNPFAVANDLVITGANMALGGAQAASDFVSPGNRFSQGIETLIREGEDKQSDVVKVCLFLFLCIGLSNTIVILLAKVFIIG